MKLRMGTRGSALALAQSGQVAEALKALEPGLEVETVVIKTSGDLFASQTPVEAHKMAEGTKGLFVKEIEEALLRGEIDFAVHSAKDLPADLAPGLRIGAYPARVDARDAFIGREGAELSALAQGARLATSSLRRKVQLLIARPDLRMVPMRGNVDTRLRKLSEGYCDGLILAAAGLRRLGRADVCAQPLSLDLVVPAPGQGALALEIADRENKAAEIVSHLNDARTRLAVEFERAFLKALGGGCSTPLGAHAVVEGCGVSMTVFYSEMDGSRARRLTQFCDDPPRREEFAAALAAKIRAGV